MESKKDGEKKKIVFQDVENDQEEEVALQMKALATGMRHSVVVSRPPTRSSRDHVMTTRNHPMLASLSSRSGATAT